MKTNGNIGQTSEESASSVPQLGDLLKTENSSVAVLPLVIIRNHPLTGDQVGQEARDIEQQLLRLLSIPALTVGTLHKGTNKLCVRQGVFRFDGVETWQIGFRENLFSLRDALGLHQMHYLLQHPFQSVSVMDLAQVRGQEIVINKLCAEEVIDAKASAQYAQKLRSLKDELYIARRTGNSQKEASLEGEIETLERHRSGAYSRSGIARRLGDQGDQVRKRVRFTLNASLKKIISLAPELGEHLEASLNRGFECGYFPLTSVRWAL